MQHSAQVLFPNHSCLYSIRICVCPTVMWLGVTSGPFGVVPPGWSWPRWRTLRGQAPGHTLTKAVHRRVFSRGSWMRCPMAVSLVMVNPAAPYRCPPGPHERMCMIAHHIKTNKPKSVLGDASIAAEMPKSAFSANSQTKVVANAIEASQMALCRSQAKTQRCASRLSRRASVGTAALCRTSSRRKSPEAVTWAGGRPIRTAG